MNTRIPLCFLKEPADCKYRVDGKLSHVYLCGGNELDYPVKQCEHRRMYCLHVDILEEK